MKKALSILLLFILIFSIALTGCDTADIPGKDNSGTGGNQSSDNDDNESSSGGNNSQPGNTPGSGDSSGDNPDNGNGDNTNVCAHTDTDNNGICDKCEISVIIVVDFYAINDLHGKFDDADTNPGVDELTTYFKNAYSTDEHAVIISSGDMWQGSSESNLTKGLIITDWMNELDIVAMTLGNHEFDWGEAPIESNAQQAEFPFLAINVYDKETNKLADYCAPSVMVDAGGIQIGIIGAIGDCYSSIAPDKVEGVYFKVKDDLTELVKAESQRLRASGADYIVYSLHDGYTSSRGDITSVDGDDIDYYYDIELSSGGYVDLVFEGHTHMNYVLYDSYGVYHLQNKGDNGGISHVEVKINIANLNSSTNVAEFVPTDSYTHLADDPIVDELLKKYEKEIEAGTKVIGKNDVSRDRDTLRQLVADLYYQKGLEIWGDEYDIVLGGGYISIRDPKYLAPGNITYSMLQSLFPFDNNLALCSISGYDLRARFIENTHSDYFYACAGNLISTLDVTKTYYIVVDRYSSLYKPNNLTEIDVYEEPVYARDLVADFITKGGYTTTPDTPGTDTPDTDVDYEITSIEEILAIGNSIPVGHETVDYFYTTGTVVAIHNATFGNMTISDGNGNTLYVYGVYDETGTVRFDSLPDAPAVGETVVLMSVIKRYHNTKTDEIIVEFYDAKLIQQS